MKPQRKLVVPCRALVAALSLAAALPVSAAATRSPCTPRPAEGEVTSQAADAQSIRLDAAHPTAIANWDARSWQRRRVWIALEAANAGDTTASVRPEMVVDARPDGHAAEVLVGPTMAVAAHARATQRLALFVPDDTKTVGVRLLAAAPAQPVAATFALECSDGRFDLGETAPAIVPALDEAVATWFNGFVDPLSDPKAALETVHALSSGAQDVTDVVWTLRGLMQSVNDDHGFIVGPGEQAPARRTLATRAPEFDFTPDGIAVVRLHAVDTSADAAALAWAASLHDGIADLAAHHPHAWIVDLRDHDGDNPWPSLAALWTLLAGPAVGATVNRHGSRAWIVDRGAVRFAGEAALVDLQPPPEPTFRGPVAVLIGPGTRDAGEDVAVAFRGRAHTRFFGAATAGFPVQGVVAHKLSSGITMGVLETREADRAGVAQREPLEPETVLKDDALAPLPPEAVEWVLEERASNASAR